MLEIDRHGAPDPSRLEEDAYVSSLLAEGLRVGRLDQAAEEQVELKLIALLAARVARRTGGESSSVPVETAQAIMESNLFTLGLCLQDFPTPDLALEALCTRPAAELYARGREIIDSKVRAAKARHQRLVGHMAQIPNECYLGTAREGLCAFFRRYDPDFAAQEIHITADYPLAHPPGRVSGIVFIQRYVDALVRENELLIRFDSQVICRMLMAYHSEWRELIINLFERVLAAGVGCVLTGEDPMGLSIPAEKVFLLQAALLGKTREELAMLVGDASHVLCQGLQLPAAAARYVCSALPTLTAELSTALETLHLNRLFLTVLQ